MNHIRQRAVWAFLLFGILSLFTAQAQTLPKDVRAKILVAVVQVIPLKDNGDPVGVSGSGTIISPKGYILTNFHVIGDTETRKFYKTHAILFTNFPDQPPEYRNIAEVVATDATHDLAILRITKDNKGKAIASNAQFPAMPVGDSTDLIPGDPIYIVGYPGISGSTITFTAGLMSGWVGEDFESGGKQWIKTDGKIAHGNSGGAAFNADGELIGVPTAGRTQEYDPLDREQQAYVRPIGLAWAIIGPNVPDVLRRGSNPTPTPNPQPSPNPQPAPKPNPSNNWPPVITKGASWQVVVKGGTWTGTWAMSFNDQDSDGDFVGVGTQLNRKEEVVAYQRENVWRVNIGSNYPYARCRFDPQDNTGTIQGTLFQFKDKDADAEEIGTCTAVIRAAANTAAWPPKLVVGQTWKISIKTSDIDDQGTFKLNQLEKNGDYSGVTVFSSDFRMDAFFFIGKQTGALILDLTDPKGKDAYTFWYRCRLEKQAVSKTLKGTFQSLNLDKDGNESNIKNLGTCEMTMP